MEDKILEFSSLQDFISIFDDERYSGSFYFLGEAQDFGNTKNMASGYRWLSEVDG